MCLSSIGATPYVLLFVYVLGRHVPRRHWGQFPQATPGSTVEWAKRPSLHAHLCLDIKCSFFVNMYFLAPLHNGWRWVAALMH